MVTYVCVSVCPRPRARAVYGPGCDLGEWWKLPPGCALLSGFAVCVEVTPWRTRGVSVLCTVVLMWFDLVAHSSIMYVVVCTD